MRIRTIRPEFYDSDSMGSVSWDARFVYICLWSYVYDNGVGKDNARLIRGACMPMDGEESLSRIESALAELAEAGSIVRYVRDGKKLLWIPKFLDYQKITRPGVSPYEPPECGGAPDIDDGTNIHDSVVKVPASSTNIHDSVVKVPASSTNIHDSVVKVPASSTNIHDSVVKVPARSSSSSGSSSYTTPTPPQEGTADDESLETYANTVWERYPVHSGQQSKSLRKVRQLVETGVVSRSDLIAAVDAYAESVRSGHPKVQFAPQLANWISKGQWRDWLPTKPKQDARASMPSDAWTDAHVMRLLPDGADTFSAKRRLLALIGDGMPWDDAADVVVSEVP